jgi:DNA-directed RNA polymerase subunit RPC12/RpoP
MKGVHLFLNFSYQAEKTPPLSCPKCPRTFKSKMLLKAHVAGHDEDKPYPCSVCGRTFLLEANRKLHVFLHDLDEGRVEQSDGKWRCPVETCVVSVRRVASLRTHLSVCHVVEEVLACHVCEAEFAEYSEWKVG